MGWERDNALGFSEEVLAYRPVDGVAIDFQLPDPVEAKIRLVLLDLRGIGNPPVDMLNRLAGQLKSSNRQLAVLTENKAVYRGLPEIPLFADGDEYYNWLAGNKFYRKLSDPFPVFTITKEEMEEMLANPVTISDIIAELEAVDEVAA